MSDQKDKLIKEIEEMLGHKIRNMTLRDLHYLSDDCFSTYNDLIGHRIDRLINMMHIDREGVVK
jgi:hypothetical protein